MQKRFQIFFIPYDMDGYYFWFFFFSCLFLDVDVAILRSLFAAWLWWNWCTDLIIIHMDYWPMVNREHLFVVSSFYRLRNEWLKIIAVAFSCFIETTESESLVVQDYFLRHIFKIFSKNLFFYCNVRYTGRRRDRETDILSADSCPIMASVALAEPIHSRSV